MSVITVWRCVDCAALDEVIAPEPSRLLGQYVPEGWTLTKDDADHYLVRCAECTIKADSDEAVYAEIAEGE